MDFGGAGISALRLHKGLLKNGIDSKVLVLVKSSNVKNIFKFEEKNKIDKDIEELNQIKENHNRLIGRIFKGEGLFTDCYSIFDLRNNSFVQKADIINLRWVSNFLDFSSFFPSVKGKPIVWRLSDMNPFTGGCHFAGNCLKYREKCNDCPQLGGDVNNIWKCKQKAYDGQNMHIVAPSNWLGDCVKNSKLFKDFPVHIIQNGLDINIFNKKDKKYCRKLLNLPLDKIIILFGAQNANDLRKGGKYFIEALENLGSSVDKSKIVLAVFGENSNKFNSFFPVYSLGKIREESMLVLCYNAADIFVNPSLAESFGQTTIESMACGIPVVAFNTGPMPKIIKKNTGLLARYKDSKDLAKQIQWMIGHPKEREKMGVNARKIVEEKYTLDIQARKYIELYKNLLKK